jgi:hypothetical protein
VELSFRSSTYQRGKAVTLAALLIAGVMLAAGPIVGRRRRG